MNTLEIISQALSQQKKDVTRVETKLKNTQTELIKQLNIDLPEHITPATQYINQMIDFVKGLEEKGYTYRIEDGIYFDVNIGAMNDGSPYVFMMNDNLLNEYEICTEHKINHDIFQKEWSGKFAGKREGYKIKPLSEKIEVLGRYTSVKEGAENSGAIATAIITTSMGAKWAVFGFDIWNRFLSTSRRNQIFNTLEYISGNPLPARMIESFSSIVLPRKYKNGNLASVSVVNCMPGESGEYHIKVQMPEGTKALYMSQYGKKEELTVGADGVLKMPSLDAWKVATVFFEE